MPNELKRPAPHNSVEVLQINGLWIVRISADGTVEDVDFDKEAHALSFAAGQRIRLRKISKPGPKP